MEFNMELKEDLNNIEWVPAKSKEITDYGQFYPKNIATIKYISKVKLSGTQISVYDLLCCLYNQTKQFAFPGYEYMAATLGIESRTAMKAVKKLVKLNLVKKENRIKENGSHDTNRYVPYCIKMGEDNPSGSKSKGQDKKSKIRSSQQKSENNCPDDHPTECSSNHPRGERLITQLDEFSKNNSNKKSTSISTQPKTLVPGMPDSFSLFSHKIHGMTGYNGYIEPQNRPVKHFDRYNENPEVHGVLLSVPSSQGESYPKSTNKKLENYQKEHIYFTADENIKKIYDLIKKINEDFGIGTSSWRMNNEDLKNIQRACEDEAPEHVMNHIIRMASKLKIPKKSLGVSYFLKKYIAPLNSTGCGVLI